MERSDEEQLHAPRIPSSPSYLMTCYVSNIRDAPKLSPLIEQKRWRELLALGARYYDYSVGQWFFFYSNEPLTDWYERTFLRRHVANIKRMPKLKPAEQLPLF